MCLIDRVDAKHRQQIYNSRNYMCLIDVIPVLGARLVIYNSRNYKCLIDVARGIVSESIYNSRNYKCLID